MPADPDLPANPSVALPHATDRMAAMRVSYSTSGLDAADLAATWFLQFQRWLDEAVAAGLTEPNAMVLATAGASGEVSARTVLAKKVDSHGVIFYTNYRSAKSQDMTTHPQVAVTFPWYDLQRQVHIRGTVARVSRAETEAYWAARPRGSQIGSAASPQSTVVASRAELDVLQHDVEQRYGGLDPDASDATPIPAPDHWGGWRISPRTVEFWQGRFGRMHDRLRYRHVFPDGADNLRGAGSDADDGHWIIERLAP